MARMAEVARSGLGIRALKEVVSGLFWMGEEDFPVAPEAEALAFRGIHTAPITIEAIIIKRNSLFFILLLHLLPEKNRFPFREPDEEYTALKRAQGLLLPNNPQINLTELIVEE